MRRLVSSHPTTKSRRKASFFAYTRKWWRPKRRRLCHIKALLCLDLYLGSMLIAEFHDVSRDCNEDIQGCHTGIHLFKKVLSTPTTTTTTTSNNNKTASLCQATPLQYLELDLHLPHDDPAHVHRVRASLWHMLRADLHHPAIGNSTPADKRMKGMTLVTPGIGASGTMDSWLQTSPN